MIPPERVRLFLAGMLLASAALVAHGRSISNGYVWDDDLAGPMGTYPDSPHVLRSQDTLVRVWSNPGEIGQYYPLVHTTYWLEYRLWGDRPAGYHAVNVLLHAGNAVLLWLVLRKLGVPAAWFGAALFAVHPVGVESVAWVTERKNTLSMCMALGSLLSWLRFRESDDTEQWWYWLALALFVAALLSKTVTVSLVGVILVIAWWKTGRITGRDLRLVGPFVAVGLPLALTTVWLEKHQVGAADVDWGLSPFDRIVLAGRAICFYATKLLWPRPLAFFYDRWQIDARQAAQWLSPAVVVTAVVGAWCARHTLGRGPLAAILLFCGCLFPALGFFDVYPFKYSFVADHFQYHAMPVVLAAAAAGVTRLTPSLPVQRLLCGAVVVVLAMASFQRCAVFADLEALYLDTLDKSPRCSAAAHNLGMLYLSQGRQQEAEPLLRYGATASQFPDEKSRSLASLALLALRRGQGDAAIELATEAERVDSTRRSRGTLALALVRRGRREEARKFMATAGDDPAQEMRLAMAEAALQDKDLDAGRQLLAAFVERNAMAERNEALLEAGIALAMYGYPAEAERLLRTIDGDTPVVAKAKVNLGICAAMRGDYPAAIRDFQEAIRLAPRSAEAHGNLAKALAAIGRREDALAEFRIAEQLSGNAFAFRSDYEQALQHTQDEAGR
jgi:tetratricopeptide (TPR) repeat protein